LLQLRATAGHQYQIAFWVRVHHLGAAIGGCELNAPLPPAEK
jgi:hypothetical protein